MGAVKKNLGTGLQVITLFIFCCLPLKGQCLTLYKQYVLRQYGQQDILCEPYIVRPDDYVSKLFRQKGNISYRDYPRFIKIFKHINPDIDDINTILAGQYLLIPLSRVQADTFPEHAGGIVKVPFITLSNRKDFLKKHSDTYKVQKGDSVSGILSTRFRKPPGTRHRELLALFKQFNPHLTDINRIYPGQTIFVPHADLPYQPWYPSLLQDSSERFQPVDRQPSIEKKSPPPRRQRASLTSGDKAFQQVADLLGARLINKGWYCIPHTNPAEDIKIDLKLTPLMEFNNGGKVFFYSAQKTDTFSSHQRKTRHLDHVKWIEVASRATAHDIFQALADDVHRHPADNTASVSDGSIDIRIRSVLIPGNPSSRSPVLKIALALLEQPDQQVPQSLRHLLEQHHIRLRNILMPSPPSKSGLEMSASDVSFQPEHRVKPLHVRATQDRKAFIKALSTALKMRFASNIDISFFYHDQQIQTVCNLISNGRGQEMLVDFGNLQGEAMAAVEKSGFSIVSFAREEPLSSMISKLLRTCHFSYQENPTIALCRQCIELTFTGFRLNDNRGVDTLICKAPVHDTMVQFLTQQNIQPVLIELTTP